MSGYTPLFNSALDGTLFGKWPHTGIWTCLLSQADRHGAIDMHPNLLAAKIGVPVETLMDCIHDFMQPDPGSRTKENEGRRLELIDPESRDWGWRVINHTKYREKARLRAKNAAEVESGKNKDRMGDRRGPPKTAADHLSDSDSDSDSDTNKDKDSATRAPLPAGEMAIALRDLGVAIKSTDKVLLGWLRDGFTTQQAIEAVGIARIRKPWPERIPANYLDPILRQPQRAPPSQIDRVTWRPPPDDEDEQRVPN